MKHLFISIGFIAGLLSIAASCTTKNAANDLTVSQTTDSTSITLTKDTLIQNIASADITKKDTFRYEKKGPFVENDTTFLYRFATNVQGYHCFADIYIEKDRQSESYQRILKCASTYEGNESYDAELKQLKEKHPQSFPKYSLSDLPRTWIPLCSFQNKYYINELDAYYPCWITDSLYIKNYMDGPTPFIIQTFKQISPTHYHFDLMRWDNLSHIDLQIIDKERKIAIVTTDEQESNRKWQTLYVAKETAPLFDLIAWYSSDMPNGNEIDFDEIDFDTLLKQQE